MESIPRVENGYWWVIGIALAFTAIAAFENSNPDGETFVARTANRFAVFLFVSPVMVAMLSVLAGCALLAYKTFLYLKFGVWPPFMLVDVLNVIDLRFVKTEWLGVNAAIIDMLSLSGLTSLLLWIPLICVGITTVLMLSFAWVVNKLK
jgi:hypothetical protein